MLLSANQSQPPLDPRILDPLDPFSQLIGRRATLLNVLPIEYQAFFRNDIYRFVEVNNFMIKILRVIISGI